MKKTLAEIAEIIDGEIVGDPQTIITGICGIKEAKEGDITFVANSKYLSLMNQTHASAIITSREVKSAPKPIIRTDNPSLAFAKMVALFAPNEVHHPKGIHPTAVIGKEVKLGKDVAIHAYSVIEDRVEIGDHTVIYPYVYIGHFSKIGSDCLIYSHVSIRERVSIGNRVCIHSGTVIGSDGFGFATVKGVHHKIPQIGTVVIEDDVEIGANVTIDRARFGRTFIGKGTKIDNLVQIAHNVEIGENSIIVAQTGISGSTVIGKGVILAGQSGVVGHITIGDNAVVAAQAGVTKSVPPNTCVSGYPAKPHNLAKRINACIQRLPRLFDTVAELRSKLQEIYQEIAGLRKEQKGNGVSENNQERS
ncbi:MAG: UDP-3-O-(3-hydroxymyristoyl)glucosamine N-acyltransferase [Candidatus Omnitrophica bacterium]|nr:UDP-3-O-(3-hydroxymyristoyl)glucosamine N-acyltransferase [Candidatus Omnitrophota bacterium]